REYPNFSAGVVKGRTVRPKGLMRRLAARKSTLIVGDEGVSAIYDESHVTTIRWDECEAGLVWPDGAGALVGCDGDRITVPADFFGTSAAKGVEDEAIRHLTRARLIPM